MTANGLTGVSNQVLRVAMRMTAVVLCGVLLINSILMPVAVGEENRPPSGIQIPTPQQAQNIIRRIFDSVTLAGWRLENEAGQRIVPFEAVPQDIYLIPPRDSAIAHLRFRSRRLTSSSSALIQQAITVVDRNVGNILGRRTIEIVPTPGPQMLTDQRRLIETFVSLEAHVLNGRRSSFEPKGGGNIIDWLIPTAHAENERLSPFQIAGLIAVSLPALLFLGTTIAVNCLSRGATQERCVTASCAVSILVIIFGIALAQ